MRLQVFGTGCQDCKRLARVAEQAARELGLDYTLERVEEVEVILSWGVRRAPALGIDGRLVSGGRVPPVEEVKALLLGRAPRRPPRPARPPLTAALRPAASAPG
jgi:small redox-active disulfide protein 2